MIAGESPVAAGLGHSIRPGEPRPLTLLAAEMTDGSFLLQGYPSGPTAFVAETDAAALRAALDAAFGSSSIEVDVPPLTVD